MSVAPLTAAQVNAEVDTALVDINLDHLLKTALPTNWATDVASGSALDNIADDGTAVFDRTTDSLQAVKDHIGDGTNLTEAGGDGDHLNEAGGDGDHLTAINLPNQIMDITGSLSGSVGSVTGAVGSVTGHTNQTGDTFALANGATGFAAIDTVVDAIKVATDKLTFTVANQVDCNIQYVNDVQVAGTGAGGDEWGPV